MLRRSRWKTWEAAPLHFGHTPEEVALRLEDALTVLNSADDAYLPDDLPVALLVALTDAEAGSPEALLVGLPLRAQEALEVT